MDKDIRVLVTGGYGFVGHNLVDYLQCSRYTHVLGEHAPDWADTSKTHDFFDRNRPTHVFHCAGFVRGIAGNLANQEKAYRVNCQINTNVVAACVEHKVKKVVALGTVAMYPGYDRCWREEEVMSDEPDAEYGYAMAKRGMLAHLEVSGLNWAMPICTNMYGPHDRFDKEHGHVIPSLVRKFHERDVTVWGNGSQRRDFMYIKDAVRALVTIMEKGEGPINMATGETHSIRDVTNILSAYTGCDTITWDETKPLGHTHRSYDVGKLAALGFKPEYTLEQGLKETIDWYAENEKTARK